MRWIVVTENSPATLHLLLESARRHMPSTHPDVIVTAHGDREMVGYAMAAKRFKADWHGSEHFRDELVDCIQRPTKSGNISALTLLCGDECAFINRFNPSDSAHALVDPDVLGLSLIHDKTCEFMGLREGRVVGGKMLSYTWLWEGRVGIIPTMTVWRTADLLCAMARTTATDWRGLVSELQDDRRWPRKLKMACLEKAPMAMVHVSDPSATIRYCRGEVLDAVAGWKTYTGEE